MANLALLTITPPADANEGDSGNTTFRFVVTRSGNTTVACSATWTLTGGVNTADLATGQATTGTVSFSSGVTTQNIDILVKGDTTVETNETMTVTLSSPSSCILGKQPDHGTIVISDTYAITYTPATNYVGSDSFTYTVQDVTGRTSSATVNITVTT